MMRDFWRSLVAPGPFALSKQESVNTEERIAQILKEAQNAMVNKNGDFAAYANSRIQASRLLGSPSSAAATNGHNSNSRSSHVSIVHKVNKYNMTRCYVLI